jgi:predicted membrane protein
LKGLFSALHPFAKKYPFRTFFALFAFFLILMSAINTEVFANASTRTELVNEIVMPAWLFALGFLFGLRFIFR